MTSRVIKSFIKILYPTCNWTITNSELSAQLTEKGPWVANCTRPDANFQVGPAPWLPGLWGFSPPSPPPTSYASVYYTPTYIAYIGGAISIRVRICAVSRVCANESHAVFHRPGVAGQDVPPIKLSAGHVVPLGQLVLGSGVPLRSSCPPTLYHEEEIILHCAIICSCFTQRGTSVLLGACSRGGTRC